MGVKAKTVTGAQAKLFINGQLAGVFGNVSYGVDYDLQAIYILGRYNAAELVYTGMGTVEITASGFRVLDNGPYEIGSVPLLQELLQHEDITLAIVDRKSGKEIMTTTGVRPRGYSNTSGARGLHELNVTFSGITLSDESGPQDDVGAVNYG